MLAVGLTYAGLASCLFGMGLVIRPWRVLFPRNRHQALPLVAFGIVLTQLGIALPATETRVATPQSQFDQFVPVYQFQEFHGIEVASPCSRTYEAIKEVTAGEIPFFETLTWIRRFGRDSPEGILNMRPDQGVLEVALRTSFLLLSEEKDEEIVMGTAVAVPPGWRARSKPTPEDFRQLHAPGFALAAINFRTEPRGPNACVVTTETRVYATDGPSRRKFARYWRVIYPGSALLRRMWLRAIKRRAESRSR